MSTMNRREVLRSLLTGALQTAGTVVLACSALPAVAAQENQRPPEGDLQERADRLASEEGAAPEGHEVPWGAFRRGGFANGAGGGAFRRGGFANGGYGGGGFRRGGWRNI
jgi:hypothetical protein